MATGEILRSLSAGQKASLDGSEFIVAQWSRSTALNYPVVVVYIATPTVLTFVEKISVSHIGGSQIEVYPITDSTILALIGAASNSSIRLRNKKIITASGSFAIGFQQGEITPAQYSALLFGEDIYTRIIGTTIPNTIFDFSQSNILFSGNPLVVGAISGLVVTGVAAASEIFVSWDLKQINPAFNAVN